MLRLHATAPEPVTETLAGPITEHGIARGVVVIDMPDARHGVAVVIPIVIEPIPVGKVEIVGEGALGAGHREISKGPIETNAGGEVEAAGHVLTVRSTSTDVTGNAREQNRPAFPAGAE